MAIRKVKHKVVSRNAPQYVRAGNQLTEEAGKMYTEFLARKRKEGSRDAERAIRLAESYGITFKEDMTLSTASGAFTVMLSDTLYSAAISNIKNILDLVFINDDLKDKGGFGAYKIPRLQPTTAVVLAEGAVIDYFDEGVDSVTVTPQKVVAGTKLTWEVLKRGMNDFVRFVLQNSADAITRKLASDILNGLAAGAGLEQTGGMSYDNVIDCEVQVQGATYANGTPYGFLPNKLVLSPSSWGTLAKSQDWKDHVHFTTARPGDVIVNHPVQMFGNMEIVITPFLTGALGLVVDSHKAAMLVRESELETFEGQLPGTPDREIIGLMSYVLAMIYPKAACRIVA